MTGSSRSCVAVVASTLAICLLIAVSPSRADGPGEDVRLLDVPYLIQSEELCGGAAASMVLQYWGDTDRTPGDFAHLIDADRHGIPTGKLVEEMRSSGWAAIPFRGDPDLVRRHLDRGRPVVALIEDRPDRYHYVVLVGWPAGAVILHDPAIRPFRVLGEGEFRRRWSAAGSWALLVVPADPRAVMAGPPGPAGSTGPTPTTAPAERTPGGSGHRPTTIDQGRTRSGGATADDRGPCREALRAGVEAARSGDDAEAEVLLATAMARCPEWSDPVRETAALHLRQDRPEDAERLAERVTTLEPGDRYAWRVLGVSRYLQGDPTGALRAWNEIDEPRIGVVRVHGIDRTRHPVAMRVIDLRPGALLRPEDLERTRSRLEELPFLTHVAVRYEPPSYGHADVEVGLVERPLLVRDPIGLVGLTVRSLADREVEATLSSPAGSGTVWSGSWSWADYRPGFAFSATFPDTSGLGSTWRVEARRGTRTFDFMHRGAAPSGFELAGPLVEERRHVGIVLGGIHAGDVRWETGLAWDRWDRHGDHLGLRGTVDLRELGDDLAIRLEGTAWTGLGRAAGFTRGRASLAWRIPEADPDSIWSVHATGVATSSSAPLSLWPGAGHIQGALLRAHRLHHDGTIDGSVFGRYLGQTTLEYRRWLARLGPVRLGAAGFVDVAKAWAVPGGGSSPTHLDTGVGARLQLPGASGSLRLDVARGLRDGEVTLSVAWQSPWPGWSDRP